MHRKPEDQTPSENPYDNFSLESLGVHQFFGDVDEDKAYAACEFIFKSNLVSKNVSKLTMVLNTVGGDCADGFAVIDVMKTSRIPISTVGIGTIMSMGVLMLSAGSKGHRIITRNTEIMAHQFAGYFEGKQHELLARQRAHEMLESKFLKHFTTNSTMTQRQIRDVLFAPSDRYLTPDEMLKFGLVDRIVDHVDYSAPALQKEPSKSTRSRKTSAR